MSAKFMIDRDEAIRIASGYCHPANIAKELEKLTFVQVRDDLISKQDAVSALGESPLVWNEGEYELGLRNQWESDVEAILAVPPAPSLSAQPLDSKMRSRWIPVTNGRGGYECEHCHAYSPAYQSGDDYLSKFCPACGCKMEK